MKQYKDRILLFRAGLGHLASGFNLGSSLCAGLQVQAHCNPPIKQMYTQTYCKPILFIRCTSRIAG